MKRIILCMLLCALFIPCAVGGAATEKVVLSEVTHSVFYAPQYAAMELGFFADEGIDVELVNAGGSDKAMTAVLSGAAEFGLMGPETAVYVHNQGKEDGVVVIGQLTKRDGSFLVGRAPDEAFSWEKLRGATVIGGRKGGMPEMTLEYVLRANGMEPNVDLTVRTDIQFNLMAGAFDGSDAEYVTLFEPTASLCEREGRGYIVAAVGAESGEIPYTAYMARASYLAEKSELCERFLRAVARGQKWVAERDAREVAEAIAPQFPDSDVELLTAVVTNYRSIDAWCVTPVMDEAAFERMQDVIEQAGELDKRAPFDGVVDNQLAEKAVRFLR